MEGNPLKDPTKYRFVEVFAGHAEATNQFRLAQYTSARVDLTYMDAENGRHNPMDLLSPAGMASLGIVVFFPEFIFYVPKPVERILPSLAHVVVGMSCLIEPAKASHINDAPRRLGAGVAGALWVEVQFLDCGEQWNIRKDNLHTHWKHSL